MSFATNCPTGQDKGASEFCVLIYLDHILTINTVLPFAETL